MAMWVLLRSDGDVVLSGTVLAYYSFVGFEGLRQCGGGDP